MARAYCDETITLGTSLRNVMDDVISSLEYTHAVSTSPAAVHMPNLNDILLEAMHASKKIDSISARAKQLVGLAIREVNRDAHTDVLIRACATCMASLLITARDINDELCRLNDTMDTHLSTVISSVIQT
jgi:hypothetical protein